MAKTMQKKVRKRSGERAVIVCARNAIVFGYTTQPVGSDPITLHRARWAYYWVHPDNHAGLAATGPQKGSRVGPPCTITLYEVAGELDATASAPAWDAFRG